MHERISASEIIQQDFYSLSAQKAIKKFAMILHRNERKE